MDFLSSNEATEASVSSSSRERPPVSSKCLTAASTSPRINKERMETSGPPTGTS